ncbi:galectin-2-like [Conger conger]|uniref:galectin-2-like n=1 Tax=Conger conger TaxID=82655 RepID=UPI002A5ACE04|nr:galectin-2-like [Conger conger]
MTVEFKNMSFKSGMELKVTGSPNSNAVRFVIEVRESDENVALHFTPTFPGTIIMNSRKDGVWGEEVRSSHFPYQHLQEFAVTIGFTDTVFYINLHDGHMLEFPNRLKKLRYDFIKIYDDVKVNGIDMK